MRALRVFIAIALTGCANSFGTAPEQGPPSAVVRSPSGKLLCAVHRYPLVTVDGWQYSGLVRWARLTPLALEEVNKHPNRVPCGYSLYPRKDFPTRAKITYCRMCEADVGPHGDFW